MMYRDPRSFRQALEQRLKAAAHGDGARLARDRKRVVFDRLLVRLLAVAPDQWLLKGGFALDLRLSDRARATKDVDIDWWADREVLLDTLLDAADHDAGDFFVFHIERAGVPADRLGGSHRFRVTASLADRPFETFLLDVGFRPDTTVVTDVVSTTDILAFAGIASVAVPALALEYQVAEKLHAYTRAYAGDQPSSRVKDLVDIALIAGLQALDGQRLHDAIESTFTRRGTHEVPAMVPFPPRVWQVPYRELATAVGIAPQLAAGHRVASVLVNPILDGAAAGRWDPRHQRWSIAEPHSSC